MSPAGHPLQIHLGAQAALSKREAGSWRVCLSDVDTGNTLFQSENQGASLSANVAMPPLVANLNDRRYRPRYHTDEG